MEFTKINSVELEHAEGWEDGVILDIWASEDLIRYADRLRYSKGYCPFFEPIFGSPIEEDGYYDFYMMVGKEGIRDFWFVANHGEDDWAEYRVKLNEDDAKRLFALMDAQCIKHYQGTIAELADDDEF